MRIAFVGTGVMGKSMVVNLLKAGHEVVVYTRTKAKAEDLFALGAHWADSPAAAVHGADAAISMVGYPNDVEEVWQGFLSAALPGCLLIDMTTSSPSLARKLAAAATAQEAALTQANDKHGRELAVLGRKLDKSSFRRRLHDAAVAVGVAGAMRTGAFRPAQLYQLALNKND